MLLVFNVGQASFANHAAIDVVVYTGNIAKPLFVYYGEKDLKTLATIYA